MNYRFENSSALYLLPSAQRDSEESNIPLDLDKGLSK